MKKNPFTFSFVRNPVCAVFLLLITQACATYPTQEMSDARQAVRAAEAVGADTHLPTLYNDALALLSNAENKLSMPSPEYAEVRSTALAAKNSAVKARHLTVGIVEAQNTIKKFESTEHPLNEAKRALEKAFAAIEQNHFDDAIKYAKLAKNLAIQGR